MNNPEKRSETPGEDAETGNEPFLEEEAVEVSRAKQGANLLFLAQSPGFRRFCSRIEQLLQGLPILKDLFFVIRPESTWNRVAAAQRGAGFVLVVYVLPMMLLLALVEGHGLMLLGRQQVSEGMYNRFTFPKVFVYETGSSLLVIFLAVVAAAIIRSIANACHARNSRAQSLVVMFHSIGPMFLIQLFNGFPNMYLWLTWLIGVSLTIGTLYHGLPRIMQPDPPAAMGLFFGSGIVVFLVMLGGRLLTGLYLAGDLRTVEAMASNVADKIFR
jgi:hypothetical protein